MREGFNEFCDKTVRIVYDSNLGFYRARPNLKISIGTVENMNGTQVFIKNRNGVLEIFTFDKIQLMTEYRTK